MLGESFAALSRAHPSRGSCKEQSKIFINRTREGSEFGQLRQPSRMAESRVVQCFPGGLKFLISYVAVEAFTPGNCTSCPARADARRALRSAASTQSFSSSPVCLCTSDLVPEVSFLCRYL